MDHTRQYVALDIETDGLDPRTNNLIAIALYCEDPEWGDDPFLFLDVRGMSAHNLRQLLMGHISTNPKRTIIGHNLQFDLGWLKEKAGIEYPAGDRLWDTMLAEQLLTAGFDDKRVNLADTVERHFGVRLDKELQTSFTMDSEITEEQIGYIRGDVEWLPELAKVQAQQLSEQGMNQVWEVERFALPVFTEMVRVGINVDLDRLQPLLSAAEVKHATLKDVLQAQLTPALEWPRLEAYEQEQAALNDWNTALEGERRGLRETWYGLMGMTAEDAAGFTPEQEWVDNKWNDWKINKKDNYPEGMRRYVKAQEKLWREKNKRPTKPNLDTDLINLNSPVQMPLAFSNLGIPLPNFKAQTIAQKLVDATPEQTTLLRSLMEYKKVEKLLSSFGDQMIALIGSDGRLRGNFKQIGTGTGRPSCSDPNMLQIPKDKHFRSCFTASPGHLFIVADYSQMELRVMAQLSKDPAMIDSFLKGLDLHSYTASLMFNKPIEQCGPDSKERKIAKTINFGTLYGMGAGKLRETLAAEGIVMTFPEAKAAIMRWKATYKKAAKMIEQMGVEAVTLGYTATPFGRRRFFNLDFVDKDGNKDDGMKFAVMREGANHPIQGTNADITKLAMHLIQEHVKPVGGRVLLNVYDETVTEIPEHLASWAEVVVQSCMRVAAEMVLTDVPAVVDSTISRSWSDIDALAA